MAPKVVVVGGGIMGCSVAYHLATRYNVAATLVEECGIACAASGKAGGFLAKNWSEFTPLGPLSSASFDLHMKLATVFNDCQYRRLTTFSISVREDGDSGTSSGIPPWLDNNSITDLATIGTPEFTAQVHPGMLSEALWKAAAEKGAKLHIGKVTDVQMDNNTVTGVSVDNMKTIECDTVVIAMGPWSGNACQWFPTLAKVNGQRAHSITVRPENPTSAHALFTEYVDKATGKTYAPEVYPRPDGEVYLCGMSDKERLPSSAKEVEVKASACDLLKKIGDVLSPSIAASSVDTKQACYLPTSPDGLPLVGKIPKVTGAYIASGHSCWGILNGPGTGLAIAQLICEGKSKDIDISAFDPGRF